MTNEHLAYIKDQWVKKINEDVSYRDLNFQLYSLLKKGFSSEYLVFAFDYIVKNNLNLNYPQGFKYFVERQNIKDAYQKQKFLKSLKRPSDFFIEHDKFSSPQFKPSKISMGFQNILGGKGNE